MGVCNSFLNTKKTLKIQPQWQISLASTFVQSATPFVLTCNTSIWERERERTVGIGILVELIHHSRYFNVNLWQR